MPPPAFVLVWDLDDTLGNFHVLTAMHRWGERATVHLRPGIGATLERLSAAGFVHTVLTLASPAYAEIALRGTGLRHHFAEVACAGQRRKGDVEGIAGLFGIAPEDCPHRMLFVGDHPLYDPPRAPGVVFHLEVRALERHAGAVHDLVLALREQGGGSLRGGFDALSGRGLVETTEPGAELRRVEHPGLDPLLLLTREHGCPVVVFGDDAAGTTGGEPVSFVPAEFHSS